MKLFLRILILLCYFMPFTFFFQTCVGVHLTIAYNEKDAAKDLQYAITTPYAYEGITVDTITNTDTVIYTKPLYHNAEFYEKFNRSDLSLQEKIACRIYLPTDKSLSGISSISFYKNLTGQILIGISLFFSIILLISFKLKNRKIKLYLIVANILSLIAFIIVGFISEVTVLWGCWLLLILLILLFIVERYNLNFQLKNTTHFHDPNK